MAAVEVWAAVEQLPLVLALVLQERLEPEVQGPSPPVPVEGQAQQASRAHDLPAGSYPQGPPMQPGRRYRIPRDLVVPPNSEAE